MLTAGTAVVGLVVTVVGLVVTGFVVAEDAAGVPGLDADDWVVGVVWLFTEVGVVASA